MKYINTILFVAILCLLVVDHVHGQTPAFPGAGGFGKYTTGGRGGDVIEVTNLNDSGDGSLRAAIEQSGARTIVFRVSGTIFLESDLEVEDGDLTIAGQTAPGGGITLANYPFEIQADNVIVRFIRSRMGDAEQQEADAFTCTGNSDVIVDHCSFSWGIDEVASSYRNHNFTMQWCIVSESLNDSYHSKGSHGYGGIWGGDKASFHHNLIAHHTSRTPRFNGARYEAGWNEQVDFRNNVIFNWGSNNVYGGEPSELDGNKANINIAKNYYKAGPATSRSKDHRILEPYDDSEYGYSKFYIDGNYVHDDPEATEDNWSFGVQSVDNDIKEEIRANEPFEFEDIVNEHSAIDAFEWVVLNSGAVLPTRDEIDARLAHEAATGVTQFGDNYGGGGKGIIDSQDEVGGWPDLEQGTAPTDSDQDGMPDDWEDDNGLNKNDAADRNDDADEDGYTNLEEYLNELASSIMLENLSPLFRPFELMATTDAENANVVDLQWQDRSDGEDGFVIERSLGNTEEFEEVGQVDADVTEYTDEITTFSGTVEAYYRVKAIQASESSFYSDVASTSVEGVILALDESDRNRDIKLFPNPVKNQLNLLITHSEKYQKYSLSILDTTGKKFYKTTITNNPKRKNERLDVDISGYPSGVYFIHIESDQGDPIIKRFIKY